MTLEADALVEMLSTSTPLPAARVRQMIDAYGLPMVARVAAKVPWFLIDAACRAIVAYRPVTV